MSTVASFGGWRLRGHQGSTPGEVNHAARSNYWKQWGLGMVAEPVIPTTWEAEARGFLKPGVRDQPV